MNLPHSDYERLFQHVMGDYNMNMEPFEAPGSKIEVEFGVTPIYLDLDQHGILKVGELGYLRYKVKRDMGEIIELPIGNWQLDRKTFLERKLA